MTCQGDKACPIPARESGYCRRHELMLNAPEAFTTQGFSQSVANMSDRERARRSSVRSNRVQRQKRGLRALVVHRIEK